MLAEQYLLLHTLPMAAQTFGASAVILSPILNLFLIAAALLLFLTLIQNNFIRNMFAGVGFMGVLNSLFSNNNSRGSRVYNHTEFYPPTTLYRGPDIHQHPSTNGQIIFNPIRGHGIQGHPSEYRGSSIHQHPSTHRQNSFHPIHEQPSESRGDHHNPVHRHH
jgi:hypothetical protein